MRRIKAKYIIEVLIHLAFWIGVYYTLSSLTSSAVKVQVNHNGKIEKMAMDSIFPASRFTLVFLALLFYGNIFWIFRKIIRHKNLPAGIAIAAGWFILTFMANYFLVGPKLNHNAPFGQRHLFVKFSARRSLDSVLNHNTQLKPSLPDSLQTRVGPDHLLSPSPAFFAIDDHNNWFHMQLTMLLVFLVVAGLSIAYFFLKEWARNELVRNQLEANQLSTEIKFLKSQINPHFLFNTLNNLFSMAQDKGNDELADGISKLSGMMRYMIYESNAEKVPLTDEIAYIKNCIALNKLRYADEEAAVTFNYPEQVQNVFIAPMIYIPFIENAFKHGVLINQSSEIDIAIVISGKQVLFACENKNYSFVKKMDDNASGIGLENVKRRLELVYPGKYDLLIKSDAGKYAVILKINLE